MWSVEKYRALIKAAKKSGMFKNRKVKTEDDVLTIIAEELHFSPETTKSWLRINSPGPRDNETIAKLERLFSLLDGSLGRREEKSPKAKKMVIKMGDFNKHAVLCCYQAMKEYLHSDDVENEERLAVMCQTVDTYKVAIPEEIFEEIQKCINEFLDPIVYDSQNTFAQCYTDEIGSWGDDGTWHIKSEEGTMKFCANYMIRLVEIEERIDRFAMATLYPVLIS